MYRRYSRYLKDRFGERVYKVSVDAGFTCPTLDGSLSAGGCAYCNNKSFRPFTSDRRETIRDQVRAGIDRQSEKYRARKFLVYFQNFTNTYAPVDELRALYEAALEAPEVVGLIIGTRPDCLPEPVLALLGELAQQTWVCVEIGLESSHDATLLAIDRGHDYACFVDAVHRAAAIEGLQVATHVIFGLPGESQEDMLTTVDRISALPIMGVKLHHLHVVRGTGLAQRYQEEPFPLFSYEDYADFLCRAIARLREDIVLIRLFGLCPLEILIGPHWELSKARVQQGIEDLLMERGVRQGSAFCGAPASRIYTV